MITVGGIGLELNILNNISAQIEKMTASVRPPAEKLGAAIEQHISAAMEKSVGKIEFPKPTVPEIPEIKAPEISAPEVKVPEVTVPEVKVPEVKIPDIKLPAAEIELTDNTSEASDRIIDTVGKALDRVQEKAQNTVIELPDIEFDEDDTVRSLDDIINDAVKRYEGRFDAAVDIKPRIAEPVDPSSWGYDKAAVEWTENYCNEIDKAKDKLSELSSFEISSDPAERLQQEINNLYFRLDNLQEKWNTLSAEEATGKVCEQLQSVEHQMLVTMDSIDKLENKYSSLTQPVEDTAEHIRKTLSEFEKFNVKTEPVERLEQELQIATEKLSLLQKKYQELSAVDPSDKVRGQLNATERQIIAVQNSIDKLQAKLSSMKGADIGIRVRAEDNSGKITESLHRDEKAASTAGERIRKSLGGAFKKASDTGKKALSSLGSRLGSLGRSASAVVKPVTRLGDSLRKSFKSVFLMTGLYAGFRALKDGLLSAAKADKQFADSLATVKENLAVAFTPILQEIMPAINTLMSGLAAASKKIAAFTAGVFGMTYSQAVAARQKLKGVSEEAKKAKLSTAGIDELNILSGNEEEKEEKKDTGVPDLTEPVLPDWADRLKQAIRSGDWNGAGRILAERVNAVFSGIDWDDIRKRAVAGTEKVCDGINGFLENLDYNSIGTAVAGGINTIAAVINTFADKIHWENISRKVTGGLNTAISKVKWYQLGRALSAKIRILTDILYGFVTEFRWSELGIGIGDAINGWFDGIDFGKLGATLSEGIKGVFDTVNAALARIRFRSIGSKISEFINNIDVAGILSRFGTTVSRLVSGALDLLIGFVEDTNWLQLGLSLFNGFVALVQNIDWAGIVSKAAELLGAAIGAATALGAMIGMKLLGFLQSAWQSIKDYFNKRIEAFGGNIILGVFAGITEALVNIGKWIKDHIFKPFINGFKKAFGIASPSKEMMKMGDFIIDGLFEAIDAGIEKIRSIFETMLKVIKTVFANIGSWFKDKFSDAWDKVKSIFSGVGTWFSERWTDITNAFSNVAEFFRKTFDSAREKIAEKFSNIGSWFSERWTDITNAFSNVAEFFRKTFDSAREKIAEKFSNIGSWFSERWTDITNAFHDVSGFFSEKFDNGVKAMYEKFQFVGAWFGDRWNDIKNAFGGVGDWFRDKFNEAYNNISSVFGNIRSFFSNTWNGIKDDTAGTINTMIDQVEKLFNFPMSSIMGISSKILSRVFGIDSNALNYIHIPRLAGGGLATAPTLAMVGDNPHALSDPEAIAPISKLKELVGGSNEEIVEILRAILELLRSGISAELIGSLFGSDFKRTVLRIIADDRTRKGG